MHSFTLAVLQTTPRPTTTTLKGSMQPLGSWGDGPRCKLGSIYFLFWLWELKAGEEGASMVTLQLGDRTAAHLSLC